MTDEHGALVEPLSSRASAAARRLDDILEGRTGRKRLGAFYTGGDVAAYIARGTILPCLLGAVFRERPGAFGPDGPAGRLLRTDPDRYIPEAVRRETGLPAETGREHAARRQRCNDLRDRLRGGRMRSVDDLLTNNLDLTRFTADLLTTCTDAGLLRAFWHALTELTVLDPACGAGAFLFAAFDVLEPLYAACLDRMQRFVGEVPADAGQDGPSRDRFIRRSVLLRNLYGVDLMPEAVEVCRLGLLLRLGPAGPGMLPAVHVRTGDALAGRAFGPGEFDGPLAFPGPASRGGFDVVVGNPPYVECGAQRRRYEAAGYRTAPCGNLFALMLERGLALARPGGRVGMIVPVAAVCTDDYAPLQRLLRDGGTSVVSSFNDRPGRLFPGLEHARLCIVLHEKGAEPRRTFTTAFNRWRAVERPFLFDRLAFTETTGLDLGGALAKVGTAVEVSLLEKVRRQRSTLRDHVTGGRFPIHYTRKLSHFVQVLDFVPGIWEAGRLRAPSELKTLRFGRERDRDVFLAVLNSGLFYWLLTVYSDCRNLNKREVERVPFDAGRADPDTLDRLAGLARALMDDLRRNARVVPLRYRGLGTLRIECTYPRRSKALLDEIDRCLARHYALTAEELDFVIHFDVKYRMGK